MAGASILVLEQDPLLGGLLVEILTNDGYRVRACPSREALCSAGRGDDTAVAIIEAWGDSHSALSDEERREIQSFARAVPTILVTGRPWAHSLPPAELGVLGLVRRPFAVDELRALIQASTTGLLRDSGQARVEARQLRRKLIDAHQRLRRASRRLDEVSLLAAEGRILEALAGGADLTGTPQEVAARFGLKVDELDLCLAHLGTANWIWVQRAAAARLAIRLERPVDAG